MPAMHAKESHAGDDPCFAPHMYRVNPSELQCRNASNQSTGLTLPLTRTKSPPLSNSAECIQLGSAALQPSKSGSANSYTNAMHFGSLQGNAI
eukprot:1158471-Pelagomonas_calceolata.AAC.10